MVPLRPLTLGDFLGGAVATIRRNPMATVGMAALVTFVFMLVPVIATLVLGASDTLPSMDLLSPRAGQGSSEETASMVTIYAASGISGVFSALATIVVTGLIMHVVEHAVTGRHTTAGEAWWLGRGSLLRLAALSLLVLLPVTILAFALPIGLGVAIGLLVGSTAAAIALGVLGGLVGLAVVVFLYVRYALLAAPDLVLEGNGPIAALRRAGELSRGQFWRLLGISLLAGLIAYVASSIVGIPFAVLGVIGMFAFHGSWLSLVSMLLSSYVSTIITGAVISPFSGSVAALQYYDQRFRKEGHDIELLNQTLGRAGQ